ncbi:molybdopterin molybdotransferase MoeA [Blastomonas sp. SL216]|uniref:molybdopterin molybdotransferase MoeA n=1 Tax=Blastomonas sp. SL216 TaxID=2995169 RepID=UPI0023775A23|nr:molybdopterin molybdotransferase MoeA [Blastomonas sp. SL216]
MAGGLIALDDARDRLLALARPCPAENLPLHLTTGLTLAETLIARRNQPAADLSAMDGYAVRSADLPGPWRVIGESAAGRPFAGVIGTGEAARISTGAMVPDGADCVVVQEDVAREGEQLTLTGDGPAVRAAHIRRAGHDFAAGAALAATGTTIDARLIALAAMAGHGALSVHRRPRLTIISTGDELVMPGLSLPSPAHIPASNGVMLAAMLSALPVDCTVPPLLPDDRATIAAALDQHSGADIIVTTGGASVGDHDLIQPALADSGGTVDFWRIAMRPGKPVMVGRLGDAIVLGLPGNPVSAYVTATLLLLPLVRKMLGYQALVPRTSHAMAGEAFPANGPRQDFVRAVWRNGALVRLSNQDSGALSALHQADALVVRAAHAPAANIGEPIDYIALE